MSFFVLLMRRSAWRQHFSRCGEKAVWARKGLWLARQPRPVIGVLMAAHDLLCLGNPVGPAQPHAAQLASVNHAQYRRAVPRELRRRLRHGQERWRQPPCVTRQAGRWRRRLPLCAITCDFEQPAFAAISTCCTPGPDSWRTAATTSALLIRPPARHCRAARPLAPTAAHQDPV